MLNKGFIILSLISVLFSPSNLVLYFVTLFFSFFLSSVSLFCFVVTYFVLISLLFFLFHVIPFPQNLHSLNHKHLCLWWAALRRL